MSRLALSAALLLVAGCSMNHPTSGGAKPITPATAEQKAALLDRMASLAGTWEMADEKGKKQTAMVFAVTSNGSAVREVMFPGSPHEMTNVYHLDGPTLVAVHYCAQGNQPNMRASAAAGDRIAFKFDHVTNMTSADQTYMGELTIIFKDADHIREEWQAFKKGQPDEHVAFDLERKKG